MNALVPLRGGSKQIPGKNIKLLADKPLCWYAISQLVKTPAIEKVYVSTDSEKIANVVKAFDLNVIIITRPEEISGDTSTTEETIEHFFTVTGHSVVLTAQATSPFTTHVDYQNGIDMFYRLKADSLVTVTPDKGFFWDENARPLNYEPANRPMRQHHSCWYRETGAFYITSKEVLAACNARIGKNIAMLSTPQEHCIDIDTPLDWLFAEFMMRKRGPIHVS